MFALLLLACAPSPAPVAPGWTIEVVARAGQPGEAVPWQASARAAGAAVPPLAPGECVSEPAPAIDGGAVPQVRLSGALQAGLLPEPGGWRSAAPLTTVDPAWSVSDLLVTTPAGERRLTGAVRFGPAPELRGVERPGGGVQVRWDPRSVDAGELAIDGVSGALRCGVGRGGVLLPAAAAPGAGVQLRVRSVSTRVLRLDGVPVEVRTVLERVVPVDAAPVEVAPLSWPPAHEGTEPVRRARPRPFRG